MKTKKRRFETYSFYDHTGLEAHLTNMARQGWLLEKVGTLLWTYRKIEPRELTFCVCYFSDATQYDPEPSEEQQTFYDFCQHTGWVLAASNVQLQVFYNERENPVPIETDPMVQVQSVHRSAKKRFLWFRLIMLALAVYLTYDAVSLLIKHPLDTLCDPGKLFLLLLCPVMLLIAGAELGGYYSWRRRAVKAAEQGEFLPTKSHPVFVKVLLTAALIGLVWFVATIFMSRSPIRLVMLIMFGGFTVVGSLVFYGVKGLLKRKKVDTDTSFMVTRGVMTFMSTIFIAMIPAVLFAADQGAFFDSDLPLDRLPLTIYDLVEGVGERELDQDSMLTQSLLVGYLNAHQSLAGDETDDAVTYGIDYNVAEVKFPVFYDICKDEMLNRYDTRRNDRIPEGQKRWYEPADPAPWGAEEAYQRYRQNTGPSGELRADPTNKYLLCYPDRIVEINFSDGWQLTPEQMALVAEKLGSGAL